MLLFTDGFVDQFGGEKGKKLGTKKFKELIINISNLSCLEQKQYLKEFFLQWKQNEDQNDDVNNNNRNKNKLNKFTKFFHQNQYHQNIFTLFNVLLKFNYLPFFSLHSTLPNYYFPIDDKYE